METEQKFLIFNLGSKDTAVISLQQITEVLQVSTTEICGVPQMPSCVFGIYNWRGEMLWLVDLEEMLGYTHVLPGKNFFSTMKAIVVQNEGKSLGLLVRQLMDIEWLDTKQMKATYSQLFSAELSPFLQGYFINDSGEMIINLDVLAILQASIWRIHN